jgi:hypothetical protein
MRGNLEHDAACREIAVFNRFLHDPGPVAAVARQNARNGACTTTAAEF